jgi:hypothetical protein
MTCFLRLKSQYRIDHVPIMIEDSTGGGNNMLMIFMVVNKLVIITRTETL